MTKQDIAKYYWKFSQIFHSGDFDQEVDKQADRIEALDQLTFEAYTCQKLQTRLIKLKNEMIQRCSA